MLAESLQQLFETLLLLLEPDVLITLIIIVFFIAYKNKKYKDTTYYKITKNPYLSTRFNKGKYGEYLTYKLLKNYEAEGSKLLFNIYIPKDDDTTTEIDALMINENGLFVFESKNFSGWIFGNENQTKWCQTLPLGRSGVSNREYFYNPIMQNRSHIKHLKTLIGNDIPIRSIIVFSERCVFKDLTIFSKDIEVIHRNQIPKVVSHVLAETTSLLTKEEVEEIYNKLYPYTQVNEDQKLQHISNIKNNNSVGTDVCPKCGGKLVIRTASKGVNANKQFLGCENFPRCTYTRNIN